jgi:predicted enzyme related to lactoylglutathione lyase
MASSTQEPSLASGKICYIEIPATDVQRSADFYSRAFGWPLRRHGDGSLAFDDTVGHVSGMWVLGRKPATEAGLIISIMLADGAAACAAILAAGGAIVRLIDPDASEITAWFRDPAGNVMGIYRQQGLAGAEGERAGS